MAYRHWAGSALFPRHVKCNPGPAREKEDSTRRPKKSDWYAVTCLDDLTCSYNPASSYPDQLTLAIPPSQSSPSVSEFAICSSMYPSTFPFSVYGNCSLLDPASQGPRRQVGALARDAQGAGATILRGGPPDRRCSRVHPCRGLPNFPIQRVVPIRARKQSPLAA